MPKVVNLQQDRSLILTNFDGYKLSLNKIPVIRQELEAPAFRASPSDEQYSYFHTELFSMQNLLVPDPWDRTTSYFVNGQFEIIRSSYDVFSGRPYFLDTVYHVPQVHDRLPGDYNYSMKFVSEHLAVVCDGVNQLYLLLTGERATCSEWRKEYSCSISREYRNFILVDSRLDYHDSDKIISCALMRVDHDETSHAIHVYWATIKPVKNEWTFKVEDVLVGKGSLRYCAFERDAKSIIISSNRPFAFKSNANELSLEEKPVKEIAAQTDETVAYTWTQTDKEVNIKFDAIEGRRKNDFTVKGTKTHLMVFNRQKALLDEELYADVDHSLSTWSIEDDCLQITLVKQTPKLLWLYLVHGRPSVATNYSIDNLSLRGKPIPNLETPLEECDIPLFEEDNEFKIERFNLDLKKVTHQILLGNNPPLFTTTLWPIFPPAIVTRQDIDASLWLQQYDSRDADEWNFRHEGNLHAFGYVQASKPQKKFMDCSPDLSYAVVCESHRHVFLYKVMNDSAEGLRKRNGPQVSLGKQYLVTLGDIGEVLGLTTDNSVVMLLAERCILYLQIK